MEQAEKLSTKERIIQSAKDLLMEGNTNPSMRLVAARSNVTKSAIYYFFRDKKDLFLAVMQTVPAELRRKTEEFSQKKIAPDKKLEEIVAAYLVYMRQEKAVSHLVFQQIFAHDKDLLQHVFEERRENAKLFHGIISEGIEQGVFYKGDSEKMTGVLMGLLDFFAMALILPCPSHEEKCSFDPEGICKQFLDLLRNK